MTKEFKNLKDSATQQQGHRGGLMRNSAFTRDNVTQSRDQQEEWMRMFDMKRDNEMRQQDQQEEWMRMYDMKKDNEMLLQGLKHDKVKMSEWWKEKDLQTAINSSKRSRESKRTDIYKSSTVNSMGLYMSSHLSQLH
jgi:hypothetical protein